MHDAKLVDHGVRPLTPRYGPGFNIVTVIVPLHVIAHWQFDSYQFTSEVTDVTKFEADNFNTAVIRAESFDRCHKTCSTIVSYRRALLQALCSLVHARAINKLMIAQLASTSAHWQALVQQLLQTALR